MSKISRVHRVLVGMVPLLSMMIIRSFVWYKYVPGVMDVWHSSLIYLVLLPIDGALAELYGFWSGEKRMAFLIGFLPTAVSLVLFMQINVVWQRLIQIIYVNGGLAVGMGIMGFGGAKYKVERKKIWLVAGFLIWLFFLLMVIGLGWD